MKDSDNVVNMDTRCLLEEFPCSGEENGKKAWYGDPHFQNGNVSGTFRHVDCIIATRAELTDSMCHKCKNISQIHSFRQKVQKRHRRKNSNDSMNTTLITSITHQVSLKIDYGLYPMNCQLVKTEFSSSKVLFLGRWKNVTT